jgi:hypothetical protein
MSEKIPVTRISMRPMTEKGYGPEVVFKTLRAADTYVAAHPYTRFEFQVSWQDNTKQVGRATGKTVSQWLRDWLNWMLADPDTLEGAAKVQAQRDIRLKNPSLIKHAVKLRDELEI